MEMKVAPENDGLRLDRFLKRSLPELTAGALYRLARKKKIRINGRPAADVKSPLCSGDLVVVEGFTPEKRKTVPAPGAFPVLFEDEVLLALDKPRGWAVHPGKGAAGRTVIEALRARAKGYEPFLVHRLDKYTSGVMLVAKDRETAARLGGLFRKSADRETRKRYLTIVFGGPEREGRIDLCLDGRPALTRYRTLQEIQWGPARLSLLEVEIDTGRTHQIRRHLAAVNLPVAGDDEYGDWDLNKRFAAEFKMKRYLLHSREIRFRHPVSGVLMTLRAPIPKEFYALFKEHAGGAGARSSGDFLRHTQ